MPEPSRSSSKRPRAEVGRSGNICRGHRDRGLVNLKVARKPALETVPLLQEAIAQAEAAFNGKGRTLVRYSGTENKIRLLVECEDAKMADEQVEKLRVAAVQSLCD